MGEQTSNQAGSPKPTAASEAGVAPAANTSASRQTANQSSEGTATPANSNVQHIPIPTEPLPEDIDEHVEANDDEDDRDSAYASSLGSDGTSVTSTIYRGYIENGRKYSTLKEGYYQPSDEHQFEVLEAEHVAYRILDSQEENPLFHSPISEKAQNILDCGTGNGSWALDVADNFPSITVRGVDLYPPSITQVAPNLMLEVDDITKPWTWNIRFDLIHMRELLGACSKQEWKRLYKEAYDNLAPGGWLEHIEGDTVIHCDDNTMPKDSLLAGVGPLFIQCADTAGKSVSIMDTMRASIEEAGFINVHEKNYKMPIGPWPKHPVYRDAGRVTLDVFKKGMEGWMMFLLTHFGPPTPWSPEEVQVYLAKLRKELDSGWHVYQRRKRVWAQKPFDDNVKPEAKVEVQDLSFDNEEQRPDAKKQKFSPPSPEAKKVAE